MKATILMCAHQQYANCDRDYVSALQEELDNLKNNLSEREKVLQLLGCGKAEEKTFFTGGKLVTFQNARTECANAGGQLATPDTAVQNKALQDIVNLYKKGAWIGVIAEWSKNRFVYLNRQPVRYTNWNKGEPNNEHNVEECVEMYTTGTWNDKQCNVERLVVCEF
ncbi:pulmonary surfactant-associated protein D-like isoform X2 [Protopterus annectens]|uniref:pulmonary surfactant-associated protein D-like isoform X2 n=1 Tax=Protopterus annectens TaxID=7888 RepID=UPI001CFA7EE0|nr:pulmonary surfactant-associated protein D-like isoform X2 [Protopterus annectens]